MTPIFMDTSAWIAQLDPGDQYHPRIQGFFERLDEKTSLVTSNLILSEFLTFFVRRNALKRALPFYEKGLQNPFLKVVWIDPTLHEEAVKLLEKFSDQKISFVDATSFAIMKKHRIRTALTFDDDFVSAGFQKLPE